MTPLRTMHIQPLLAEVDSNLESHYVPRRLSELTPAQQWMKNSLSEEAIAKDITIQVAIKHPDELLAECRPFGFRSLTSDEWEWACAAGSRTMWKWGNDCPTDGLPYNYHKTHPDWNLHLKTNAFGLVIAYNDYSPELCAGHILRGGDGGSLTCGGVGVLAVWLLLASAYLDPYQEQPTEPAAPLELCSDRRVLSLDRFL